MADTDKAQRLEVAAREFIVGGQRSGKSRRAEALARSWLDAGAHRQAVLIATATAADAEMQARIERHRADRACSLPTLRTVEEPLDLGLAIAAHSAPDTLVVVDCLTLWLSNRCWPEHGGHAPALGVTSDAQSAIDTLTAAITAARGPLVLVSNEIGWGVVPMGPQVRAFVDALGQVNQATARHCDKVTLMVAGQALTIKGAA